MLDAIPFFRFFGVVETFDCPNQISGYTAYPLKADLSLVKERLHYRTGHFMNPALLDPVAPEIS